MDKDLRVTRPQEEDERQPIEETPDQATTHQDGFRKVMLGQASDPLFPPHPEPPEATEDDLTQEALNDPGVEERDALKPIPPLWRALLLIIVVAVTLSCIFWWWR